MFLVPAVTKMMRLARAFRTSNSQICNICKNDYLPGQIFLDRENNILRCVECEWEATYMTKIYPGEKPAYTPHPPKHEGPKYEGPKHDNEQLMERPPKRRDHHVEKLQ
jgi:hypothetical protein